MGDTTSYYNGVQMHVDLREYRPAEELLREAVEKARQADIVIVFGGLNKSDYQDAEGHDRRDYSLPYGQDALVEALVEANPNVVYVNISGNAVRMPWVDRVPAIVQGWFGGSEAGEALANVLTGRANPSGKLPYTWFAELNDVPAHQLGSYPGTWREGEPIIDETYADDIFVGYRGVEKFGVKPLFAFGHGLSYTTFELSEAKASKKTISQKDNISFTLNVKNTGTVAGAEVVQLYVSDLEASVERPAKELKAFQKAFLQPGEQRTVTLTIGPDALSFYDEQAGAWRAEAGDFEALIGTASDHITSKVTFTLK